MTPQEHKSNLEWSIKYCLDRIDDLIIEAEDCILNKNYKGLKNCVDKIEVEQIQCSTFQETLELFNQVKF